MSLWGDKEVTGANTGTVTVFANGSVVGDGTDFENEVAVQNYVAVDGQELRVVSITNAEFMDVVAGIGGGTVANVAAGNTFTVSEKPIYLSTSGEINANDVYFVDTTEISVASNKAKGIRAPGWVKVTSAGGRTRSETLVVMKRTAAAAGDAEDAVVADS